MCKHNRQQTKKQKTNKHKTKLTQAPRTRLFVPFFSVLAKAGLEIRFSVKTLGTKQKINKKIKKN